MKPNAIEFKLPVDQWREAPPPDGADFLALWAAGHPFFVPNIMVTSGELAAGQSLADQAEQIFVDAQKTGRDVQLVKRDTTNPRRVLQAIGMKIFVNEQEIEVGQFQTLVQVDEAGGDRRGYLAFSLAATREELRDHLADYEAFIGSATPVATDQEDASG